MQTLMPSAMTESQANAPERLVAIGASAGGLEALQVIVAKLPALANTAYVVAQHLAADHPSQLVELLARKTALRVISAADGTPLTAGTILVIPPGCDATVTETAIQLQDPLPRYGPSPSIDQLFDSLAHHWGPRAVAVVLSGTGSDAALGLRAVGAAGGVTLVQAPQSARFDGMPRAAIALGGADWIGEPAMIAAHLHDCFSTQGAGFKQEAMAAEAPLFAHAAAQLKEGTGIDFSQYKHSTLRRQIQRRMATRNIWSIEEYLALLSSDSQENQALSQNLLVSVTAFFRNPEAFTALANPLRLLIARLNPDDPFRVWVPGCATGEEAYSIAMTISEVMDHPSNLQQRLKIFATDLDEHSLAIGRRGSYPLSAAKNIPERLIERFITVKTNEIEINKDLRSCLVFARHNIGEEPPFPNIDLISFRNTLIYFNAPLQERVLDVFSFSLQPGSLLFLGSSESLGRRSGFTLVNPLHRIYERSRESRPRSRIAMTIPMRRGATPQRLPPAENLGQNAVPNQHINLLETLLRSLAPPSLVLDENHNLVEVIGDVSPYCRIPEGQLTASAGAFLRDELQSDARALFLLVRADRAAASSRALRLDNDSTAVRLEAMPVQLGDRALTVLSFHPDAAAGQAALADNGSSKRDDAFAREIERLERELLSSQETLRRSMGDLEQANEELEASSEELQASSEELQSSNEELEASNEELQATNEELGNLNQQLRCRSDELELLNTDLENIQSSLSQGMVIVDRNLRITRFSPLAVRVFGMVASDIGQPLIGVPTTVPLPNLRQALLAALDGKERSSIEATSEEMSYLAQVMPYRNKVGECLGAILTLTDISELVALRQVAQASLREFTNLADALDQVVWKRDYSMGQLLYVSGRIKQLSGWSAAELGSSPQLLDQAIVPADRARVEAVRSAGGSGWSVIYHLIDRDGQERTVQEVAVVADASHDPCIVGTLSDISGQRLEQRHTRLLASGLEALLAHDTLPLALVDPELRIVVCSQRFCDHLGLAPASLTNQPLERLSAALCQPDLLTPLAKALLTSPDPPCQEHSLTLANGGSLSLHLQPLVGDDAEGDAVLGLLLELAAGD